MSEQARIETAIDTTIDNCEVLRARLAKYEDADGKPITTITEQAREIASLRNIISECATACGAAVSVECSEEFMAMLPDEIRTVMTGKTREIERLSLMVSQADHNYDCDRSDWQRELAALKAQPSGVVLPDPLKRGDEGGSGEYGAAMIRGYNACLREVARLNSSPAIAGEAVIDLDAAAWTQIKEAASQSAWMPEQYFMNDWVSDICALLREPRTGTAPNHGEQVRNMVPEGWKLVPVDPCKCLDMGWAYLDAAREVEPDRSWAFSHAGYRAMLAAAPSAGSQDGDV